MALLRPRRCCLCLSPRSGAVALGCAGALAFAALAVPEALLLGSHDRHLAEFVRRQRAEGVEVKNEDIPEIAEFSRWAWTISIFYDAAAVLASLMLVFGAACGRRTLLAPWLTLAFLSILASLVFVLALMMAQDVRGAIITFMVAAPALAIFGYFWLVVYSAFHQLNGGGLQTVKAISTSADESGKNVQNGSRPTTTATTPASADGHATSADDIEAILPADGTDGPHELRRYVSFFCRCGIAPLPPSKAAKQEQRQPEREQRERGKQCYQHDGCGPGKATPLDGQQQFQLQLVFFAVLPGPAQGVATAI